MIDVCAENLETPCRLALPRHDGARYHFDYTRLRQDIERIRGGIRDYLAPQRTQPRDPTTLIGDYRRESETEETS